MRSLPADRETDRQSDRQAYGQADSDSDTETHTYRQRETETDRERRRQTDRQTEAETDKKTDIYLGAGGGGVPFRTILSILDPKVPGLFAVTVPSGKSIQPFMVAVKKQDCLCPQCHTGCE